MPRSQMPVINILKITLENFNSSVFDDFGICFWIDQINTECQFFLQIERILFDFPVYSWFFSNVSSLRCLL